MFKNCYRQKRYECFRNIDLKFPSNISFLWLSKNYSFLNKSHNNWSLFATASICHKQNGKYKLLGSKSKIYKIKKILESRKHVNATGDKIIAIYLSLSSVQTTQFLLSFHYILYKCCQGLPKSNDALLENQRAVVFMPQLQIKIVCRYLFQCHSKMKCKKYPCIPLIQRSQPFHHKPLHPVVLHHTALFPIPSCPIPYPSMVGETLLGVLHVSRLSVWKLV